MPSVSHGKHGNVTSFGPTTLAISQSPTSVLWPRLPVPNCRSGLLHNALETQTTHTPPCDCLHGPQYCPVVNYSSRRSRSQARKEARHDRLVTRDRGPQANCNQSTDSHSRERWINRAAGSANTFINLSLQSHLADLVAYNLTSTMGYILYPEYRTHSFESPVGATYIRFRTQPSGADLRVLTGLVERDELRVPIDSVFGFEDLLGAFKSVKTGRSRGKVILEVVAAAQP